MQPNEFKNQQQRQIKMLYITTLVLLLPLFVSIYYLYNKTKDTDLVPLPTETTAAIPINLQKVNTTAHAAFVLSLNTDTILYQKNPDKQLPLASITKLMTAQIAENDMGDTITIRKMSDPTYGDNTLTPGELWQKKNLIAYTLVTSSNDGAYSLSSGTQEQSFIDRMNALAGAIGLTNTRFYNETGLDNELQAEPGSKGSAKDISILLSYLIKNNLPLYEKTKYERAYVESPHGPTIANNTNEVTDQIVGLLISKTGYTDLAGGNLAIVADIGLNEPTAFVVLHSSKESRFKDVLSLQEEYFTQVAARMR